MNPRILRRFIMLLVTATIVVATFTVLHDSFFDRPPGDYETERGDAHLSVGAYDAALTWFDKALQVEPNHRGAVMGRALVFIQTERYADALAELTHLIGFLEQTLRDDDPTGRGTLAAAYANRGIVHDRAGRYEKALADYIASLKVDADAVSGPGLMHKILHEARPSTVRDRARYLHEQLQLPASERLLTVPEIDAKQRMYKP